MYITRKVLINIEIYMISEKYIQFLLYNNNNNLKQTNVPVIQIINHLFSKYIKFTY